jgi:hypothetical protein
MVERAPKKGDLFEFLEIPSQGFAARRRFLCEAQRPQHKQDNASDSKKTAPIKLRSEFRGHGHGKFIRHITGDVVHAFFI